MTVHIGLPLDAQPLWLPTEALAAGPWEDIGSSRLASAAASVSFASIPSVFVMFRLVCEIINDANAKSVTLRINNDSGANYSSQRLTGDNATVAGARTSGATSFGLNLFGTADASTFITLDAVIAKPIAGAAGLIVGGLTYTSTALVLEQKAGIWSNVADLINRIDVIAAANNFAADSLFVLQGSRS